MAALTAVPEADLAIKNNAGNTPLHVAAEKGIIWSSTIKLLCKKGNADVMALLVTAPGANLAEKDKDGKTAEQLAR